MSLTQLVLASPQTDSKVGTSSLKVGDFVFCDMKPIIPEINKILGHPVPVIAGLSNDHVLMYIGNNKFIESCPYFYRPLKKDYVGVVIAPVWFFNIWATNFMYGTVNTTQEKRNAAVEWAKTKISTEYVKDGYYCGELIFHTYNTQNVYLYEIHSYETTSAVWTPWGLHDAYNVILSYPN